MVMKVAGVEAIAVAVWVAAAVVLAAVVRAAAIWIVVVVMMVGMAFAARTIMVVRVVVVGILGALTTKQGMTQTADGRATAHSFVPAQPPLLTGTRPLFRLRPHAWYP